MRELKLNGLSRTSKQSSRLVVMEHNHCEVPAGCGGVVIRWTDPSRSTALLLRVLAHDRPVVHLDGDILRVSRPVIDHGPHVLALRFGQALARGQGVFMLAGEPVLAGAGSRAAPFPPLLSKPDGSWKYRVERDEEIGWHQPDVDDRKWAAMSECPLTPLPTAEDWRREHWQEEYGSLFALGARPLGVARAGRIRSLFALGARSLGVARAGRILWVRKHFVLGPEGVQ